MESSHAVENLFTSLMWLLSAPNILIMSAYGVYRHLKPLAPKHHKRFMYAAASIPWIVALIQNVASPRHFQFSDLVWLSEATAFLWVFYCVVTYGAYFVVMKIREPLRKNAAIGIYIVLIFLLVLPSLLSKLEIWPYNANKLAEEQRVKNQREYNLIRSKPKDWLEDARHKSKK